MKAAIWALMGLSMSPILAAEPPVVTVHNEVLNAIDPRLYGQFLERASFGESGPEAATDEQGHLRPDVMALLKRFKPAIVRFPGGTDIDFINWHDMVDRVPGRDGGRPVTVGHTGKSITNRFGYDEYFALRDELGCQTIIVLNLLDGLSQQVPLAQAAMHAAGLVAYCNAPQGAKLPEGMPDWPAIRAANGHPAPFRADYIQLGNEWWCGKFKERMSKLFMAGEKADAKALTAWMIEALGAYIRAIRAVDPAVPLIIDGRMFEGIEAAVQGDPFIKKEVRYLTLHNYAPMSGADFFVGEQPVEHKSLDPEQAFLTLSVMPGAYGDDGMNRGFGQRVDRLAERGYRICYTEWNWNGWGFDEAGEAVGMRPWQQAASLGVASFLQGMMRSGAQADFANQSMLVGHRWPIATIMFDPDRPGSAHFGAQGRTTLFYKEHSGNHLLRLSHSGIPVVTPPYRVGKWLFPHPTAMLEPASTKSADAIYVHLVHRGYTKPMKVKVALDGFTVGQSAKLLTLTGRQEPADGPERWLEETARDVILADGKVELDLPPRSVVCLVVPLGK